MNQGLGRPRLRPTSLLFGGDYNPDQWAPAVWAEDVRLMARAGVNSAVVGPFSWSSMEPREGEYRFGWLDDALELLHAHGIGVILSTPTASPPPWFSLAHPDGLTTRADGIRLQHGSRDTYDPASPAYRAAAARIAQVLGERYGRSPALIAWHVHNEYGTVSFGPHVEQAFRAWLHERYGDLDELNRAWHTAFWSQGYSDWSEVMLPGRTQYLDNPTQVLDFRRFSADLLLDCFEDQISILRRESPGVPITTNLILPTWLHYDHWAFASRCDFVAIDHYPDADGIEGAAQVAFGADLARSLGSGSPWLLMEQAATITVRDGKMLPRPSGAYARSSLQHVARGSLGALTFQWRAPYAGAESFHSSMLPHAGEHTRGFRETVGTGAMLTALGDLAAAPEGPTVRPEVAITWDPAAWWAAETRTLPTDDLSFLRTVQGVHRAVWNLGRTVDFVRLDHDLSPYRVVLVPSQIVLAPDQRANLERFARAGGTVVVWYFSGTFDPALHVVPGGYSGALADLLGIRVLELHPLPTGVTVLLTDGGAGSVWAEDLHLVGAEAMARYESGELAGRPAITRRAVGAGVAHYISTELDDASLQRVLEPILLDAGCGPDAEGAGDGVEVVRRYAGDEEYLVCINHTAATRTVECRGTDLLTGYVFDGPVTLLAGATLVLRQA